MSEALRLAEWVESDMTCEGDAEIAAELRRLHAENEALKADTKSLATMSNLWAKEKALNAELVEALRWYVDTDEVMEMEGNEFWLDGRERARAALEKANA